MDYYLTGEYDCKMDAKGRVRLPSDLLKQLGSEAKEFTINRGYETHLMLYPRKVWDSKVVEINKLNIHNTKHRQAIRYFHRGASKITVDAAERILLPKTLVQYAGLKKELVLFAYQQQIEIWSKKNYDKMLREEPDDFSQIADQVFNNQSSPDSETKLS